MRLLLLETTLGQCDASRRPDNRMSHAWISIISPDCVIQHWFHLFDCLQISIGILVFQLAYVTGITQGNISHIDVISQFLSSVRRKKCHFALSPHGRIWEVLERQGDPPMLCSFNLVSSTKSCMRTCSYLTHLIDVQCTLIWILRCLQLKFCNKQKRSFLSQSTPPFLPPNEGCIATDLCWV